MSDEITVRTLGPGDEDVLGAVVDQFWGLDAAPAAAADFLTQPDAHAVAAFSGTKVVGYAYGYRLARFDGAPMAMLWDLEVKSAHRRHGIATALVDELRRACGGVSKLIVPVESDNKPARTLYEGLGGTCASPSLIYVLKD